MASEQSIPRATPGETKPTAGQQAGPDPALQRLDKLAGTWDMRGRTLDSKEDNFSGRVIIEWMPGGYFLLQHGEMDLMGAQFKTLEIVGYEPATKSLSAYVFSNRDGTPARYYWDIQDEVVTHWTEGSKYTGTLSEDGNVLVGGWRPEKGIEETAFNSYDVIMVRVKPG